MVRERVYTIAEPAAFFKSDFWPLLPENLLRLLPLGVFKQPVLGLQGLEDQRRVAGRLHAGLTGPIVGPTAGR